MLKRIIQFGLLAGLILLLDSFLRTKWFYSNDYSDLYATFLGLLFLLLGVLTYRNWLDLKSDWDKKYDLKTVSRVLSKREIQVLEKLLGDESNKEIAAGLFIENSTLKSHIYSIYRKLEVKNRKELKGKFHHWEEVNLLNSK